MTWNCITIIREAAKLCGIQPPNAAVSSTDLQVQQLVSLANEDGRELMQRHDWGALTKEKTFVTVATASQGDLVGDILSSADNYDRVINETIWNRTTRLPVFGPHAPKEWQYRQAMTFTGPYPEYRIRGGELLFNPVPTAGQTCAFEYVTKNWVVNSAGDVFREGFAADEDLPLLDYGILLAGIRWRWKQAKGLEYGENFNTYERLVTSAMARNGTKRTLSLSGSTNPGIAPVVVVPSGSWNL